MPTPLMEGHGRSTGLVEVLDRVLDKGLVVAGDIKVSLAEVELLTIRIRLLICSLDKGIVIDAWVRVSLVGIDLITVEARVVVASIDTYLKYSEAVGSVAPASKPAVEGKGYEEVIAENAALRAQLSGGGGTTRTGVR